MSEEYTRQYRLKAIFGDLAANFINSSVQKIMDAALQDYERALLLARLFVALNPPPIKSHVYEAMRRAEADAEKEAEAVREMYADDVKRGIYTPSRVEALARQVKAKVLLIAVFEALGDKYYDYGTLFKPYKVLQA